MKQRLWIDRILSSNTPPDLFPGIIERVRGTPYRLFGRTEGLMREELTYRPAGKWSIQEQVGHLLEFEPQWLCHARQILDGRSELDLGVPDNRGTVMAAHHKRPFAELSGAFFEERAELVRVLDAVDDADIARSAWHPRLRRQMSLVDLALFVAEHDDHHLATITSLRMAQTREAVAAY